MADWLFYEPFVDGGSLLAVYHAKKSKREPLQADLIALTLALMEVGERVYFSYRHADAAPFVPPGTSADAPRLLADILSSSSSGFGVWEVHVGVVAFLFDAVDTRLYSPEPLIDVDGADGVATGFIARYECRESSPWLAARRLREFIFACEGGWTASVPHPSRAEFTEHSIGCERVSGRVYYAEPSPP